MNVAYVAIRWVEYQLDPTNPRKQADAIAAQQEWEEDNAHRSQKAQQADWDEAIHEAWHRAYWIERTGSILDHPTFNTRTAHSIATYYALILDLRADKARERAQEAFTRWATEAAHGPHGTVRGWGEIWRSWQTLRGR